MNYEEDNPGSSLGHPIAADAWSLHGIVWNMS